MVLRVPPPAATRNPCCHDLPNERCQQAIWKIPIKWKGQATGSGNVQESRLDKQPPCPYKDEYEAQEPDPEEEDLHASAGTQLGQDHHA